jgi:hypothetical protein
MCSFWQHAVDLLIDVYKTTFNKMGGYIVDTDKVSQEFEPLIFINGYHRASLMLFNLFYWKQIKDKHAAYLKVSRLEKFLHELSLHEEKIFLKRYELREVSYHPWQEFACSPDQHLLMCLLLCYLQKFLRKIQREAAENEWNERNYDIVVRIFCYSKGKMYMYRHLIDSSVQEETSGLHLMDKSFLEQDSISTSNNDKPDVWAFCLFLLHILINVWTYWLPVCIFSANLIVYLSVRLMRIP